jgi:hypothetical protein
MTEQQPANAADLERRAGRILVGLVLAACALVLAVCGGVGANMVSAGGSAICNGAQMTRQDTCVTYDKNGNTTQTRTYDEQQQVQTSSGHFLGWVMLGCAAVALVIGLYTVGTLVVGRRRRAWVAGTPGP